MVCVPLVNIPPFVPFAAARTKLFELTVAPSGYEVVVIVPTPVIPPEADDQVTVPSILEAVKTKPTVGVPPVTFNVPVFNDVADILPEDTTEVAVTAPAAKPPEISL